MSNDPSEKTTGSGYGNIYTPHAGSMIIQVQREGGLANRTIVLSQRQVHLLRRGAYVGATVLVIVLSSWLYFATQAARVPSLTRRIQRLQHDVGRLDTLQAALTQLEGRFQQVQRMLGAPAISAPSTLSDPDTNVATVPTRWPLPMTGTLLSDSMHVGASGQGGIDIAIPTGTPVRAAGGGIVVEVKDDLPNSKTIKITHRDGYESIYGNMTDARVAKGERVSVGTVIGLSGGALGASPPHLHFEVRRSGIDVNPASLMRQGPAHGDLQ